MNKHRTNFESLNPYENGEKNIFFVRVYDEDGTLADKVNDVFGDVEEININKKDEYAFITSLLTEGEFKDLSNRVGNVINAIRVK